MSKQDFSEIVDRICQQEPRFNRAAYIFIRQALDYTLKHQKMKSKDKTDNHVSGQNLLEGIRQYGLEQYGPMTLLVFQEWGLRECSDFGTIVFKLVDFGVLGKTENDSLEDFADGYDFRDAFLKPFLPKSKLDIKF